MQKRQAKRGGTACDAEQRRREVCGGHAGGRSAVHAGVGCGAIKRSVGLQAGRAHALVVSGQADSAQTRLDEGAGASPSSSSLLDDPAAAALDAAEAPIGTAALLPGDCECFGSPCMRQVSGDAERGDGVARPLAVPAPPTEIAGVAAVAAGGVIDDVTVAGVLGQLTSSHAGSMRSWESELDSMACRRPVLSPLPTEALPQLLHRTADGVLAAGEDNVDSEAVEGESSTDAASSPAVLSAGCRGGQNANGTAAVPTAEATNGTSAATGAPQTAQPAPGNGPTAARAPSVTVLASGASAATPAWCSVASTGNATSGLALAAACGAANGTTAAALPLNAAPPLAAPA